MQLNPKQIKRINDFFIKGQNAIHIGDFNQGEKCFLEVLNIRNDILEAQNALAYIYTVTKQHSKAVKQLKSILIKHPSHALTHQNLANCLYEQKLYDEAIFHYLAAIKIDFKLVDSYINCGITYRMLKNHDMAISYLHQALNLDKINARAFHVLGMIYTDIEEFPKALECLENAVGLSPGNAEYRINFATVLEKVGLDIEAGNEYHKACNSNPNYLDSFILYSEYLRKHHRFDEALECLTWASRIAPGELRILDELGHTYLGLSDIENAVINFNKALSVEPDRISSLTGLELTKVDIGELNEAIKICNEIISLEPDNITGYLLKARAKKIMPGDTLLDDLLRFEDRADLNSESKINLFFALGKLSDDLNNFPDAFKYYATANTLKNSRLNYDKKIDEAVFSQIIEFFTPDFLEKHQHLGCDNNLPVFIIGMPRSATTLTEQIISSHPEVMGAGEVPFWTKAHTALPLRLNLSIPYPECLTKMNASNAADIRNLYINTLLKIAGPSAHPAHISDKMPHNFMHLGIIALLFPKAKIIHTKRNPIDTCLSIYFQNFSTYHQYAFDLENLAFHYKQYERIMQHWHKVLPGRIMDINYADTIADPEFWSRKLIDHIGLKWDDACLAPHKLDRSVKTASHWQVRQPIYKTSIERWKHYENYLQPLIKELNTPHS